MKQNEIQRSTKGYHYPLLMDIYRLSLKNLEKNDTKKSEDYMDIFKKNAPNT